MKLQILFIGAALAVPLTSCASSAVITYRTSLNTRPQNAISPTQGYLKIDKIRIHYLEWGQRSPALLLLHGLYDDAKIWTALANLLSSEYRVIAPDRRGAGDSDTPRNGYDQATLSRDVAAIIQQKKLGTVALIGHSAGGEIALQVTATYPKMVRSLILIDGGFWPKHENAPIVPPVPCTKEPRACALLALEAAGGRYDPELFYPRVVCPALLIIARQPTPSGDVVAEYEKRGIEYFDQIMVAERHVREVAEKKLSHGSWTVIEDTSHWIQRDQPTALAQSIRRFLSGGK